MTAPRGAITMFPVGGEGGQPLGAGRVLWAQTRPSQAANPLNVWYPAGGTGASVSMGENPAASQGLGFDAADGGAYLSRGQATSRLWALDDRAALQSPLYSAPTPYVYFDPCGVLIFREVLRWTLNVQAGAGVATSFHGIACVFDTQGNAGWGPDILTGNIFAGVGLIWRANTGTWRVLRKARATVAVQDVLTLAEYDGNLWALVEHRLYAPTAGAPGRYELWINQARVRTYQGTDADFPQVDANNVRYRAAPYVSENYGGKTGGIRCRRSELIVGPATDDTAAYE